MSDVLIIGFGVVGRNLKEELSALNPDIYDKYHRENNNSRDIRYKLAFICVPAPYDQERGVRDISEIRAAIAKHDADLYIIKSALLPGTTEILCQETGKHIIYSPEYRGATVHNNFQFDFTICGGERANCLKAIRILQRAYDGRHKFRVTNTKTAELVKHMENAFLATKVSFCVQFREIARQIGVDYAELRELFILDPRVNPSHTFVFDDQPYWDTPCLNNDVTAIAETYDAAFLKSLIAYNDRNRAERGVKKW